MKTLIRRRILRHLIWVCTVFLCPKKWDARLIWVKMIEIKFTKVGVLYPTNIILSQRYIKKRTSGLVLRGTEGGRILFFFNLRLNITPLCFTGNRPATCSVKWSQPLQSSLSRIIRESGVTTRSYWVWQNIPSGTLGKTDRKSGSTTSDENTVRRSDG